MARVLLSFMVAMLCFAPSLLAQDTIPPTLYCPGNLTYNLNPGECARQVFFNVFATDNDPNCTPNISQTDGTGYTSGSTYPIGDVTLSFQATDCSGNTSDCVFTITIVEYSPPNSGLVCDDQLNISMPVTCEMWLSPPMVLEGYYGCYDDFTVNVNNTGSNYIGYYYVGQTITYTVTNNNTGNTCWGQALIEDKAGPYIQGCDSVTINCLQDVRPVSEGGDVPDPTFSDCVGFSVVYMDMFTNGACSDPFTQSIMRMWTATDALGNVSTCTQVITVERVTLASISPVCPANVTVECAPNVTPNFSPTATGYPTASVGGVVFEITNNAYSFCDVMATYNDLILDKCGASYRIIRTWSVMDWCQPIVIGTNPWTCSQVIYYNDTTAPVIAGPANMTANANLPGCRARPIIPASVITDCSAYTVSILTPVGPILGNGGQVPAPGLPFGQHTLTVKATDECGNSSSHSFTVNVVDNSKPSPVCISYTVVALDDQGYGFAYATSFDNGSTDNCCLSHFRVARLTDNCSNPANLVFGEYVEFCCSDVGSPVPVVLRVFDCHGNFNDCTVSVEVQDQAGPTITCPPDVTVLCGQDYNDPALVGEVVTDPTLQGPNDGLATDNCEGLITITTADDGTVACGSGLIFRTWAATDVAGQLSFCVQRITVVNNNPFTGSNIQFPPDITVYGCDASTLPANTGQPVLPPPTGCYSLVVGHTDLVLTSVPDACRKILRTWSVIDWCQYNPNNPTGPGRWDLTQTIKVIDQDAPVFSACLNRTFCNFKDDCSDLAPDLTVSATDNCTDASQIFYTWTVDLHNDGLPDPGYVTSGSGQNTTNDYPVGTHRISYSAFDGCGNVGFCNFLFTIEDCKKPTVFCNTGIIVELMQTGMVPVNVMLLETGASNDNCSARADLLFSFSPFTDDTDRIFTCDDIGANLVQVWVTDEAGNQDFCETQVIIQDNMNACGGTPLIAMNGTVASEENEGVEQVMIELNGNMTSQTYTNGLGTFQFSNLPLGNDYTVSPFLNENPLNGVTTFDLLLLHRHILGIHLLDSPYKIIAGDVNNSKALSINDVVDLRKVILHITTEFPNNTSWRFVDKNYTFPNPANPFAQTFPEVCNVNDLTAGSPQPDFVAVKIGDLNSSAAVNLTGTGSEDRNAAPAFVFAAPDRQVKAGERVTVDFTADPADLLAWQFTLNFDQQALAFEKLTPGGNTSEENFGLSLTGQGAITASWHQLVAGSGDEYPGAVGSRQFSVTFTARTDGQLSGLLGINSRFTQAEAYQADGTNRPVALHFTDGNGATVMAEQFELYQNVPNPFSDVTSIGFQLPEASSASITIFDVSGKMVKTVRGDFSKGYHEVRIEKNALPHSGVFYYRLETPGHTATRKMMMF